MNRSLQQELARGKRKIERRLDRSILGDCAKPAFTARNIQYELSRRGGGMSSGGIGAIHLLARKLGLVEKINERLPLLKFHFPYHESDHVLNIAYNHLCGGTCPEDIELRRNDRVYLDALGARRIPDPTTAGDFCRRFESHDVETLMEVINETRLKVWASQPPEFFHEARIDLDGTLVATTGACKEGMDIAHDGTWGYHPLIVSLASTQELLYIVNRSGNRPSHEGAAEYVDRAVDLCRRGGFQRITVRGDTDFTQTRHLDRWDEDGVGFVFGIDALANLVRKAEDLPPKAWERLDRRPGHKVKTKPRARPENVKERIVRERGFENQRLISEEVAEFDYSPTACRKSYRVVVVRKNLSIEKGESVLFDDIRYFFYITNDREHAPARIVLLANGRCDQENLIEQLKNGVRALRAPVDNLTSNWAYMTMASLAWNLKAWWALQLPEKGRWAEKRKSEKTSVLRMEFKKFIHCFVNIPCLIVRTGRRIVYRVLAWNPWLGVFFRGLDVLRC